MYTDLEVEALDWDLGPIGLYDKKLECMMRSGIVWWEIEECWNYTTLYICLECVACSLWNQDGHTMLHGKGEGACQMIGQTVYLNT